MLEQSDGGLLLVSPTNFDPRPAGQPSFLVRRFGPTGSAVGVGAPVARPERPIDPLLGGGFASFGGSTRTGAGADQGSFTPQAAVQRANGSIVLAGGVKVTRYTGEGDGSSTALFAAVSLTPELGQDRSFGGEPSRARFGLRVARQRARSSARLRRILLRFRASGPGLVLVRVRDGRRILAQQVVPIYASGSSTVRLPLTKFGRSVLRSGGRRVNVGYRFVDVVRERATGTGRARLR